MMALFFVLKNETLVHVKHFFADVGAGSSIYNGKNETPRNVNFYCGVFQKVFLFEKR